MPVSDWPAAGANSSSIGDDSPGGSRTYGVRLRNSGLSKRCDVTSRSPVPVFFKVSWRFTDWPSVTLPKATLVPEGVTVSCGTRAGSWNL